jgi:hypothetical protein
MRWRVPDLPLRPLGLATAPLGAFAAEVAGLHSTGKGAGRRVCALPLLCGHRSARRQITQRLPPKQQQRLPHTPHLALPCLPAFVAAARFKVGVSVL